MSIRVEFYGVPRSRSGVEVAEVEVPDAGASLGEVLSQLAAEFPAFGAGCLWEEALRPEYTASVNGERFVRDPGEIIRAGEALLIMSADAGG